MVRLSLIPAALGLAVCLTALACSGHAWVETDGEEDPGDVQSDPADGREMDGVDAGEALEAEDEGCAGDACPEDAGCDPCPPQCGDGACEAGEGCGDCPADCGSCLPTCGAAGGDTCATLADTLCQDLPLIASSDCEVCCDRPDLAPVGPNSYHYSDRDDPDFWDGILGLADQGAMICTQNRPDAVPPERWCRLISGDYMSADEIVATIHHAFQTDPEKPAKVMIDEIEESSKDKLTVVAETLRDHYPQYAGRWGAFIMNEDPSCSPCYGTKEAAVNAFLSANAVLAAEMYIGRGAYCSCGGTCAGTTSYGPRDIWLADFFAGDMVNRKKFAWLVQRRGELGSSSQLSVLFITVDGSVGTSDAYIFIDRMFYIWVTRSGFRSFLLASNGGAGAYKWQYLNNDGNVAVSSPNRDNLFADSFRHYCLDPGSTTSRFPDPTFCE